MEKTETPNGWRYRMHLKTFQGRTDKELLADLTHEVIHNQSDKIAALIQEVSNRWQKTR